MATFHTLRVSAVEPLTADSLLLSLAVPPELRTAYAFLPGQHLTFRHTHAGTEIRRTFSICSTPASGRLEVAIKLLPGGIFSGYVRAAVGPGTELTVMTPVGRFVPRSFREPRSAGGARRYVAVCAGSGITPVMSIMTALLETEPAAEFVLVYGNRRVETVMFAEAIADLKDRFTDRLAVHHVLSREPHQAPLASGRIDPGKLELLLSQHGLDPRDPAGADEWFLCGPSALVQDTAAFLARCGVGRRQVHTEIFYLGPEPDRADRPDEPVDPGAHAVIARLEGRTSEFRLMPGETVLDALLRVRPDAPYACKGGVCGTCRMRLLDGAVTMRRNFALDAGEEEAGFRLACQSRPRSPVIRVDFDA